ncbi:hypothetical protein D3C81_1756530 [compost metagenome]
MAAIDSLPNRLVSSAGRLAASTSEMRLSKSSMVPWESFCISAATFLESRRNALNASPWALVAAEPLVIANIKFLMPVAATSCLTPTPAIVAPMAATWADDRPATSPSAPTSVMIEEICLVLAGPVLPR